VNASGLAVHQFRYEQKSYWRNPTSAVFTFAFPLLFLVIFASLNSDNRIDSLGGLAYNQYYVPAIMAFGVISATFTSLAMTLTIRRDAGILKRLRGTPLPGSALLGGIVLNAFVISALISVLVGGAGVLFYEVTFPGHWAALIVAILVGAATFCALGMAVSAVVPNADAAPAVVNGILFPVLFISGAFYPVESDSFLGRLGAFFPVRHFVLSLFAAFDPRLPSGISHGFAWREVAIVAAWGLVGAFVAVRRFRWSPVR
jgi:ABC-2 type transport system permease protein